MKFKNDFLIKYFTASFCAQIIRLQSTIIFLHTNLIMQRSDLMNISKVYNLFKISSNNYKIDCLTPQPWSKKLDLNPSLWQYTFVLISSSSYYKFLHQIPIYSLKDKNDHQIESCENRFRQNLLFPSQRPIENPHHSNWTILFIAARINTWALLMNLR